MTKRIYRVLWVFCGIISVCLFFNGIASTINNIDKYKYLVDGLNKTEWLQKYGREVVPYKEIQAGDIPIKRPLISRIILSITHEDTSTPIVASLILIGIGSILQYIIWGSLHPLYLFKKEKINS